MKGDALPFARSAPDYRPRAMRAPLRGRMAVGVWGRRLKPAATCPLWTNPQRLGRLTTPRPTGSDAAWAAEDA